MHIMFNIHESHIDVTGLPLLASWYDAKRYNRVELRDSLNFIVPKSIN